MATIHNYRFIYPFSNLKNQLRPNLFKDLDKSQYQAIQVKKTHDSVQLRGFYCWEFLLKFQAIPRPKITPWNSDMDPRGWY